MAKLITVEKAADCIGVSSHTIRKWLKNGELPYLKAGVKYLINEDTLQNFIQQGATQNVS